jgi:CO/xanthine dehydrogenase FAD-binding subunit
MVASQWTRREFLETSLKAGAGFTARAAAFGSQGATGGTMMRTTDGVPELAITLAVNGAPHAITVDMRTSLLFALVSATVALHVDRGMIRAARVAAGGVGTMPWRLYRVEDALVGQPNGEPAWHAAAARATEGAQPLTHNAFKVELLSRTVFRGQVTRSERGPSKDPTSR